MKTELEAFLEELDISPIEVEIIDGVIKLPEHLNKYFETFLEYQNLEDEHD